MSGYDLDFGDSAYDLMSVDFKAHYTIYRPSFLLEHNITKRLTSEAVGCSLHDVRFST